MTSKSDQFIINWKKAKVEMYVKVTVGNLDYISAKKEIHGSVGRSAGLTCLKIMDMIGQVFSQCLSEIYILLQRRTSSGGN